MKRKNGDVATPTKTSTPKRRRTEPVLEEDVEEPLHDDTPTRSSTRGRKKGSGKAKENGYADTEDSGARDQVLAVRTSTTNLNILKGKRRKPAVDEDTEAVEDVGNRSENGVEVNGEDLDDQSDPEEEEADEIIFDPTEDIEDSEEGDTISVNVQPVEDGPELDEATPSQTPRKRGRPKGSKTKRSPTPEGDLAPEERYFWQNRPGPPQVSNHSFSALGLLTHEEYFEEIKKFSDPHEPEVAYLMKLHARSFPQWRFELHEGFNICLYGYGSKRKLMIEFADWFFVRSKPPPRIVVINGYIPRINVRNVITMIASAVTEEGERLRLIGQPQEMVDTLLSHVATTKIRILLILNSIDGPSLRRTSTQTLLARLAAHPSINLIASADTPHFPLLWNSTLKSQYNFLSHDATTFQPYTVELNPVDSVHDLLGRKGHRVGGKEGINFVLKSLPENARNLYRILLSEILTILHDDAGDDDGMDDLTEPPIDMLGDPDDDDDVFDGNALAAAKSRKGRRKTANHKAKSHAVADEDLAVVEYRSLYQKATEEFICSSDMNFRFLLKEFHDHQMIVSRRDVSGSEMLGVPLSRWDMEGVLEDLVFA